MATNALRAIKSTQKKMKRLNGSLPPQGSFKVWDGWPYKGEMLALWGSGNHANPMITRSHTTHIHSNLNLTHFYFESFKLAELSVCEIHTFYYLLIRIVYFTTSTKKRSKREKKVADHLPESLQANIYQEPTFDAWI